MPVRLDTVGPAELLDEDHRLVGVARRWNVSVHGTAIDAAETSPGGRVLGYRWELTVWEMQPVQPERIQAATADDADTWLTIDGEVLYDGRSTRYVFRSCQLSLRTPPEGPWCFVVHDPPEDLARILGAGA